MESNEIGVETSIKTDIVTGTEIVEDSEQSLKLKWLSKCKSPTLTLTYKQLAYIILIQGFIASLISFGINYGIAVAVFKNPNNDTPTMWQFPVPIAGNFGVLAIIEMVLIYVLDGSLILMDILNGLIEPIHPDNTAISKYWPTNKRSRNNINNFNSSSKNESITYNRLYDPHWWLRPPELIVLPESINEKSWSSRIYISFIRSIPWIIVGFFLTWPLFVGVSYAIWGNSNYNSYPQPQFMSATYGGVLILLTNPWLALVTLVYMGAKVSRERGDTSVDAISNNRHNNSVIDDNVNIGIEGVNENESKEKFQLRNSKYIL